MCTTQRPATQEALVEPSSERPLWKTVPSWFLIGEDDRHPPALQHYMAKRARAHRTVDIPERRHRLGLAPRGRRAPGRGGGGPDAAA